MVTSWRLSGFDVKLVYNKKLVISRKDFGTPKDPAVTKDPPKSTDKDMVDHVHYLSCIAIPITAEQGWFLI